MSKKKLNKNLNPSFNKDIPTDNDYSQCSTEGEHL